MVVHSNPATQNTSATAAANTTTTTTYLASTSTASDDELMMAARNPTELVAGTSSTVVLEPQAILDLVNRGEDSTVREEDDDDDDDDPFNVLGGQDHTTANGIKDILAQDQAMKDAAAKGRLVAPSVEERGNVGMRNRDVNKTVAGLVDDAKAGTGILLEEKKVPTVSTTSQVRQTSIVGAFSVPGLQSNGVADQESNREEGDTKPRDDDVGYDNELDLESGAIAPTTTLATNNVSSAYFSEPLESAVTATAIDDVTLEIEMREKIMKEAVEATSVDKTKRPLTEAEKHNQKLRRAFYIFVAVHVVGAVLIGGVIGARLAKKNQHNSASTVGNTTLPTAAPTQAPTMSKNSLALMEFISSASSTSSQKVLREDPNSPQYRAFEWVASMEQNGNGNSNGNYDSDTLELYALATLYYATNGDKWVRNTNWLDPKVGICDWYQSISAAATAASPTGSSGTPGSNCDSLSRISTLSLSSNDLIGTIPDEIGLLSSLTFLDLSQNSINGTLPLPIWQLDNLEIMFVSGNSITGSFPSEINQLNRLAVLSTFNNAMTGTLPTELGDLRYLSEIDVSGNKLNGTMPSEIGRLGRLELWGKLHSYILNAVRVPRMHAFSTQSYSQLTLIKLFVVYIL